MYTALNQSVAYVCPSKAADSDVLVALEPYDEHVAEQVRALCADITVELRPGTRPTRCGGGHR